MALRYPFKKDTARTLYLDWESSKEEFGYKLRKVFDYYKQQGIYFAPKFPIYRRCSQRFTKDAYFIRKLIFEKNIQFIIIDSLVPAIGVMINEARVAEEFYEAINTLNIQGISFLIFTHVAKAHVESNNGDYTWIGSVMFGNFARSVWALKTDRDGKEFVMTLSCRYNNIENIHKPYKIVVRFGNSASDIQEIEYKMETEKTELLPIAQQVEYYLREGAKTVTELAEEVYDVDDEKELKRKSQYIRNLLNRMLKKGKVIKLRDGRWGLKIKDDDIPF